LKKISYLAVAATALVLTIVISCFASDSVAIPTVNVHVTIRHWSSWGKPHQEMTTYVYQLRQGDEIYFTREQSSMTVGRPVFRILRVNGDSTITVQVYEHLRKIAPDNAHTSIIDTIGVAYENTCFRTPTLDGGEDYCLRIDPSYHFDTSPDSLPRWVETTDRDRPMRQSYKRIKFYDSGKKEAEWTEIYNSDGVPLKDGPYREFAENGQTVLEMQYDSGKADGPYTTWFSDGQKKLQGQYEDGFKNGDWQHWDTLGRDVGFGKYDMGTGLEKIFYPDGKTRSIDHFKKGKLNGDSKLYYMDGGIHVEREYTGGDPSGTWKFYDPDGNMYFETHWPGGTKTPPTYYYKTGRIRYDFTGGWHRQWYQNGQLKFEVPVDDDGRSNGHFTSYYRNGQKESEGEVVYGMRQGVWHFYEKDGDIKSDSTYKDNVANKPRE